MGAYEYDIMGQATKIIHGAETISYLYDDLGRVTTETDGSGRTMGYDYNDAAGTWDVKYNGNNYWIRYATDDASRLSTITEHKSGVTELMATYGYDTGSRVKSLTLGNGSVQSVTYDAAGRLKTLDHDFTDNTGDATWTYDHNDNGQVTSKNISNDKYEWSPSYSSNELYSSNALNQYFDIGSITQSHDDNGNLTQDGSMTFVFNALGQMTEAKSGGTTVGTYQYDPMGRRKSKTASGITTQYLWSGSQVMAEYNGGGTLQRKYIYGPGIDNPIALVAGDGSKTYIHKDALGSVVALSNNAGTVTDKFKYDPFGKSADDGGSAYKFAARRIDAETGLYYSRNRYYNPSSGRFISPDPIGYGDGMNMYAYVGNDPMNATDPTGLDKTCTGSRIRRADGFNCSRGTSRVTCMGNCASFYGGVVCFCR
jgi:RHS repeat-associated protein